MTIFCLLTNSFYVGKLKLYLFVVISSSENFFNKQKKIECKNTDAEGRLIA